MNFETVFVIWEIFGLCFLIFILKYLCYKARENEGFGYYVFCPEANAPRVVHQCYADALTEAKRLVKKFPYNNFQVLKIETILEAQNITEDEIPF